MIKAILIDAMSTIFSFKEGLTKYDILKNLVIEFLEREVSPERIKEVYNEKRATLESRIKTTDYLLKWGLINREVLLALFPEMEYSEAEGFGILMAKRIASDPDLYRVSPGVKIFLKKARRKGIRIIVASNHDSECLSALVKHFNLQELIDQTYGSSKIGLEKPDPRFFQKILEEENLFPGECIMIGNNPVNDMAGALESNIMGILFDPRNLYPEFKGYRISQFKDLWLLYVF